MNRVRTEVAPSAAALKLKRALHASDMIGIICEGIQRELADHREAVEGSEVESECRRTIAHIEAFVLKLRADALDELKTAVKESLGDGAAR